MCWDITLPIHDKNKTYYTKHIIQFKRNLEKESFETYAHLLSATPKFQTVVEAVRNWAEEISTKCGKQFPNARALWKITCWAHHSQHNTNYPYTNVDVELMESTIELMTKIKNELIKRNVDELSGKMGSLLVRQVPELCRFFKKGHCREGQKCRFLHLDE